jgi:hypothetical protein
MADTRFDKLDQKTTMHRLRRMTSPTPETAIAQLIGFGRSVDVDATSIPGSSPSNAGDEKLHRRTAATINARTSPSIVTDGATPSLIPATRPRPMPS